MRLHGDYGNLMGFYVVKYFVTFIVQESCQLLLFKHSLGTSSEIRMEGLEQVFKLQHYEQNQKVLNYKVCHVCTIMDIHTKKEPFSP
jgi:inorganic pyrophosphatase/exopolyphosphatase